MPGIVNYLVLNTVYMTTVNSLKMLCVFDICEFSVVCIRSLCSEDYIHITFIILLESNVYNFCEHLQCSRKIFLMSDFFL